MNIGNLLVFNIIALALIIGFSRHYKNQLQLFNIWKWFLLLSILDVIALTIFPLPINIDKSIYDSYVGVSNYIPFNEIKNEISLILNPFFPTSNKIFMLLNVIGNMVLLLPFGFLLPLAYKKFRFWNVCLAGLIFTCMIEFTQLIINYLVQLNWRIVDIDDIIMNFSGVVIGYLLYKLYLKYMNKKGSKNA